MPLEAKWENMIDKKISFVIVNYNYMEDIKKLIVSLDSSVSKAEYEIIIVDNNSSDGSREYFSKLGKKVRYVYLEKNIGYGAANNVGVKNSRSNHIVFINPDTLVEDVDFDHFINKIEEKKLGVLAPKVIYPDGKIQPNCGTYATLKTYIMQSFRVGYFIRKFNLMKKLQKVIDYFPFLQKSFIGTYLDNFSDEVEKKECDWVSGACMIVRKEVFEEVGGFDENLFLYCEDEDLCRQVAQKGYQIAIDKSFSIVHNEGFIKSRKSRVLTFAESHRLKSNLYYLNKYSGSVASSALKIFYFIWYSVSGVVHMLFDPKAAKSYFKFIGTLCERNERLS